MSPAVTIPVLTIVAVARLISGWEPGKVGGEGSLSIVGCLSCNADLLIICIATCCCRCWWCCCWRFDNDWGRWRRRASVNDIDDPSCGRFDVSANPWDSQPGFSAAARLSDADALRFRRWCDSKLCCLLGYNSWVKDDDSAGKCCCCCCNLQSRSISSTLFLVISFCSFMVHWVRYSKYFLEKHFLSEKKKKHLRLICTYRASIRTTFNVTDVAGASIFADSSFDQVW